MGEGPWYKGRNKWLNQKRRGLKFIQNLSSKVLVVPALLLMMRLGGLEFHWLVAALLERDVGKCSHVSGSDYSQWSLTVWFIHVYKSVRQRRSQSVILFCHGTVCELSSWTPSSTATAMCQASLYHSQDISVHIPTLCCSPRGFLLGASLLLLPLISERGRGSEQGLPVPFLSCMDLRTWLHLCPTYHVIASFPFSPGKGCRERNNTGL